MAPTYHEVAPKIDLDDDDEAPKPTKKKTKTVSPMNRSSISLLKKIMSANFT